MTREKFKEFWQGSLTWYNSVNNTATLKNAGMDIKTFCSLKKDYEDQIFQTYEKVKQVVKNLYFKKPTTKKLNKYKRAAVIAYAICLSEPLEYLTVSFSYEDTTYLFKQRLAIYMALSSIIIEYPKETVMALGEPLFDFNNIGLGRQEGEDDFFTSICRDMYFWVPYENFNVLTMANMLQLLVERASSLARIDPINDAEE